MKIIRQFKQGRSQESIFKSINPGDVFILRHSLMKYILSSDCGKVVVVNELGTVRSDITRLIDVSGDIKAIYQRTPGDYLEDLLIQAEEDLKYDQTFKTHNNNGICFSDGRLYAA